MQLTAGKSSFNVVLLVSLFVTSCPCDVRAQLRERGKWRLIKSLGSLKKVQWSLLRAVITEIIVRRTITDNFHLIMCSLCTIFSCRSLEFFLSNYSSNAARLRPISKVVLLPYQTQLIESYSTLAWCRVAPQTFACYTVVAQLGFKRHATALPNSIHKL